MENIFIRQEGQYKKLTEKVDLKKDTADMGRGRSVRGFKPFLGDQPVSLALEQAPGIFISIQPFAGLIPEEDVEIIKMHNGLIHT